MPTCEDIREEFSALLDDELDVESRDTVEAHLSKCSDCLRELHQYKSVTDLYRALPEVHAPEGFERDLMLALRPRISSPAWRGRMLALAASLLVVCGAGIMFILSRGTVSTFPAMNLAQLESAPDMAEVSPEAASQAAETVGGMAREMAKGAGQPEPAPMALSAPAAPAPPAIAAEEAASSTGIADTPPEMIPGAQEAEQAYDMSRSAESVPMRTSGAVGNTADRMQQPPVPEEPAPSATIADREFLRVDGRWQEQGYAGEECTILLRDSADLQSLMSVRTELQPMLVLQGDIIFQVDAKWYRITQTQP